MTETRQPDQEGQQDDLLRLGATFLLAAAAAGGGGATVQHDTLRVQVEVGTVRVEDGQDVGAGMAAQGVGVGLHLLYMVHCR